MANAALGRCASQITPRLYLSDYWSARDAEKLQALGITHVLSVMDIVPQIPEIIPASQRLHISIQDVANADLLKHLETTTAFIVAALDENLTNKVLVHCMMGISRSATVVCAYLVATTEMTAAVSISYVQELRPVVCPNLGFRQQLEDYGTRFVKQKPRPSQIVVFPEGLKLTSIAARIRKLKGINSKGSIEAPNPAKAVT
ncbi:protein-tyrosine phosphatase-like protein [Crepidotus variabilis]|uniref:Protein-tyrosine phosphatase-like protein n=1 Tax=Crepidotus variabilis TaxID=179855 RepID=A0A9P6JSW3_9AGAR|nr:protein-tyrosine phosphatase-like protein [Crepidotus variabilis]